MKKVLPLFLLLFAICTSAVKAGDDVELNSYTVPGDRLSSTELKAGDQIVLQNATGTWNMAYAACLYNSLDNVYLNGVQDKYNRTTDGQIDVTDTPLSTDNFYELVAAPEQHEGVNSYYLQHVDTKQYITCSASPMKTALTDNIDEATSFEIEAALYNENLSKHAQWQTTGLVDDETVVFVHFEFKTTEKTDETSGETFTETTETRYHFGPFWNYGYSYYGTAKDITVWNVYKAEIKQDNSAYTNLKKLLSEINQDGSSYPIGEKPGYYTEAEVTAYETALYNAQSAIEMQDGEDAYLTCYKALKSAYEAVKAAMIPLTDGYYYITTNYVKFTEERNILPMLMGSNDGFLYWKDPQEGDPNYIFYVEKLESGNYNIKNFGLNQYIDQTYGSAQYVELRNEPTVEQILKPRGDGSWRMGNTVQNTRPYYPDANGYGKGMSGHLGQNSPTETWAGWNFTKVPDDVIAKLEAEVEQLALTQQLSNLVDPAVKTYNSCFSYDRDEENPLLTKFSDDPAESQVTVNYKTKSETEDNSIAYLNDNDYDTYLTTKHYNPTDATITVIDGSFAIYADLGENPVQKFVFKMSKWSGSTGQQNRPTDIAVYARNNESDAWTKIQDVTLPSEEYITDAYSGGIDMGEPFRYVRFDINDTYGTELFYGKPIYTISEFQMYPAVLNEEYSQYSYSPGMKEACDALLAQLNHARNAVANNTATQEDYDKLKAAIEAVEPLIADTADFTVAMMEANDYVEEFGAGTEYGQVTEEQLAEFEKAIAEANDFDHMKPVKSDLDKRIESIDAALEKFKSEQINIEDGKWYYISNCDTERTGDESNIYSTKVFGNVIYSQSANTEDEKLESEVDEIWHGCYDRESETQEGLYDATTMWRAIALGDTAYAFQNRATGAYLGKFYSQSVGGGLSKEPVPYYVTFTGIGQFNITCADTINVNKLPLHASGEGRLKVWSGGYNSASSWTFLPVEDFETLEYSCADNSMSIITLPFAQQNIQALNPDFKFYSVKNMPDETTLELTELKEGTAIEAGQPVFVTVGDVSKFDIESEEVTTLLVEAPDTYVKTAQTANGLVGVLYGDSIKKAGYGIIDLNSDSTQVVLTASTEDTFIEGMTGYINPKLVQDTKGSVDLTLKSTAPITSIRKLNTELANGTVNVYGIDGKLIKRNVNAGKATQSLSKGIYLVGKKKVSVK